MQKNFPGVSVSGPTTLVPTSVFLSGDSAVDRLWVKSPYKQHPWVYGCVKAIATNIASVPLKIETGPDDDATSITYRSSGAAGQLARIFRKPNPFLTIFQLFELTVTYLNLDGMCFWLLDRTRETDVPLSIYPVGRKGFRPLFDENGSFVTWEYVHPQTHVPEFLQPGVEVIVFRFIDPEYPIMGMSPMEAARRGVRLDMLAGTYSEAFFHNSATPDGVLSTEKRLTKPQAEDIRNEWENRHRGGHNARRISVLYGGMKYQSISMSQKDMEFMEQRKWTRDEVMAVYKVPKSELSLFEDVNMATALTQNRGFWEKTLLPVMRNIEEVLFTDFILPLTSRAVFSDLRIFFDTSVVGALQEPLTDKIQNAERLYRIGFPINEINRVLKLGMSRVAWGDKWYPNRAVLPIDVLIDLANLELEGATATGDTKPSNPSPPPNSGDTPADDIDVENEPDDNDDDDVDEEEGKGALAYQILIAAKRKRALENPAYAKTIQTQITQLKGQFSQVFKAYIRRLRTHQLRLVASDSGIFQADRWCSKLAQRFKDNALFEKHERETAAAITTLIHSKLMESCRNIEDKNAKSSMVRSVCNTLVSEDACLCLLRICAMIVVQNLAGVTR